MEAQPKPRHQYIYTPRYGQRGFLTYAGQQPNGAYPTGVINNGGYAYGGVGVATAGSFPVGPYPALSFPTLSYAGGGANYFASPYWPTYPSVYSGYYNSSTISPVHPYANFCQPYQRPYYNSMSGYGYPTQAYVYPPGPSAATTTTTTYRVTNSHAGVTGCMHPVGTCSHQASATCSHVPSREAIQLENRRIATERGAYNARRIKPADARSDDPFWCKERNGEWHLRSYYQIENECYPGQWLMDAERGYLVFHRH